MTFWLTNRDPVKIGPAKRAAACPHQAGRLTD